MIMYQRMKYSREKVSNWSRLKAQRHVPWLPFRPPRSESSVSSLSDREASSPSPSPPVEYAFSSAAIIRSVSVQPQSQPQSRPQPNPNVQNALKFIRQYHQGIVDTDAAEVRFGLSPESFKNLLTEIRKDPNLNGFWDDKIRYSYLPYNGVLFIKLMSGNHQIQQLLLGKAGNKQIKNLPLKETHPDRRWQIIKALYQQRIVIEPDELQEERYRVPDVGWFLCHPVTKLKLQLRPEVLAEILVSQNPNEVKEIAEQYLLRTNREVRCFIALKTFPSPSKRILVSAWVPIFQMIKGERRLVAHPWRDWLELRDTNGNERTLPFVEDVSKRKFRKRKGGRWKGQLRRSNKPKFVQDEQQQNIRDPVVFRIPYKWFVPVSWSVGNPAVYSQQILFRQDDLISFANAGEEVTKMERTNGGIHATEGMDPEVLSVRAYRDVRDAPSYVNDSPYSPPR